jgi:hypothetical protein
MTSTLEELESFYIDCSFCECPMCTEDPLAKEWRDMHFCGLECLYHYQDEIKDNEQTEEELSRGYHFL